MSEEIEGKVQEIEQESEVVSVEGVTPETVAMEGGWKPQEEWQGDDGQWIDAKTFNMRGELLDRIKSQTGQLRGQDKKIAKLESGLKGLAEHNEKIEQIALKKALNELKSLKRDALDVADHDQVVEIDDQIAELKTSQKAVARKEQPDERDTGTNPEILEWIENNPWYKKDVTLRGAADAVTREIVESYPELRGEPSKVLDKVAKRLKEEFPNKFGRSRKPAQGTVAEEGQGGVSNRSKGSSTKKYTSKHLNETQLGFGRTFVAQGAMKSIDQYIEQLAEMGELDVQKGTQ